MINQQSSETQANQYGFYAIPKAVEPRRKYREREQDSEEQYSEEDLDDVNKFMTIEREPINERQLQRDYYVDQAPHPEFKPKERGLDYGVQIEKGDLFDYDLEVQSLIEILVGRSVVSAINDLQEQKEIDQSRKAVDKYQKKRNAELMVTQRMEAKSKRKHQESDRRKLQKDIFEKNKKQTQRKLLARKNAKQNLLGLRDQLFEELDEEGYLRDTPVTNLKINYEGWLYETVTEILRGKHATMQQLGTIHENRRSQLQKQHQGQIQKERKRQKDILDKRQRERKQLEEKKRKKRIRKLKLALKEERQPLAQQFRENLQKYEPAAGKMLAGSSLMSNGLSKNRNTTPTIYISGGLINYILMLLESTGTSYSEDQILNLLEKVLKQLEGNLEVNLATNNAEKLKEAQDKLEQQTMEFMKSKEANIDELTNSLSLDFSYLESMGQSISSSLHQNFLKAVLRIFLTKIPEDVENEHYDATEQDKRFQQLREKLVIKQDQPEIKEAQNVQSFLRVRFEFAKPQQQEEQQEKEQPAEGEKKPVNLDEWINIYDGQDWPKKLKEQKAERCKKQDQGAASYTLNGFPNSYVFDERNLHYLQNELELLLQLKAGQKLAQYTEAMSNIAVRIGKHQEKQEQVPKGAPVFDEQLLWDQ